MPTPTGLPKVGEVWELTSKLPPDLKPETVRFVVLARGRGEYWSMRVYVPTNAPDRQKQLWVDAAYMWSTQEPKYIDVAGPKTKKKLNLA